MAEIELGIEDLEQFKEIGSGGFATVYAAWDPGFRRWVAVKVLHSLDDDGRRRFDRERGLMGQFDDHVNIVTPYRFGYTNTGSPYLVMEYLRGGSLQDLVDDRGQLGVVEVVDFIVPVAKALGRAHSDGVLHRDVKPANILVTTDGVPKLTDFGIATIREATSTQFAFTLAHSPPETFVSGYDERDERSDLYSLASSLFTLVAGRAPFQVEGHDSQMAHMQRIASLPVPETATGNSGLDAFLEQALAKNPDQRPQTASHFIAQLQQALESHQPPDPQHTEQHHEPAQKHAPRPPTARPQPETELIPRAPEPVTPPQAATRRRPRRPSSRIAQLANGRIASAGIDDTVQVWDPGDPSTTIATYTGHTDIVLGVVELADGRIASAGIDDTVRVWDPGDPSTTIATYTGHTSVVVAVVALADGRIASASFDATVQVWDPGDPSTTIATYTGRRTDAAAENPQQKHPRLALNDVRPPPSTLNPRHPLGQVLVTLCGFGPRTGARTLAEIGDPARFETGSRLASYAGLSPTDWRSGRSINGAFQRRGGNHRLKNAMFLAAFVATQHDPDARAYYQRKRTEGKKHNAAVICVARRRCDLILAMLKTSTAYDPTRHQELPIAA